MAFSGAGLDGRRGLAVVTLDDLVLFVKIQVVDQLAVEYDTQVRSLECNFVLVPRRGFVHLFERCNGTVDASSQFRGCGIGVVSVIRHLQFHAVKCRVTCKRRTQGTAAVAARAQFEFVFVAIIYLFFTKVKPFFYIDKTSGYNF